MLSALSQSLASGAKTCYRIQHLRHCGSRKHVAYLGLDIVLVCVCVCVFEPTSAPAYENQQVVFYICALKEVKLGKFSPPFSLLFFPSPLDVLSDSSALLEITVLISLFPPALVATLSEEGWTAVMPRSRVPVLPLLPCPHKLLDSPFCGDQRVLYTSGTCLLSQHG